MLCVFTVKGISATVVPSAVNFALYSIAVYCAFTVIFSLPRV